MPLIKLLQHLLMQAFKEKTGDMLESYADRLDKIAELLFEKEPDHKEMDKRLSGLAEDIRAYEETCNK